MSTFDTFSMMGGGSGMLVPNERRRRRKPLATVPVDADARRPYTPTGGVSNNTVPVVGRGRVAVDAPVDVMKQYMPEIDTNHLLDLPVTGDEEMRTWGPRVEFARPEVSVLKENDFADPEQDVMPHRVVEGWTFSPHLNKGRDIIRFAPMSVEQGVEKGLVQVVGQGQGAYTPNNATMRVAAEMREANENSPVNVASKELAQARNATRAERWTGGPTSVNNRRAQVVLDRLAAIRQAGVEHQQALEGARTQGEEERRTHKENAEVDTVEILKRPMMQGAGNVMAAWNPRTQEIVMSDKSVKKGWESLSDKELLDTYKQLSLKSGAAKPEDLTIMDQIRYDKMIGAGDAEGAKRMLADQGGLSEEAEALMRRIEGQLRARGVLGDDAGDDAGKEKRDRDWRSKMATK